VQLVEVMFNEYANERSGVGRSSVDITLPKQCIWQVKPTEEMFRMYGRRSISV